MANFMFQLSLSQPCQWLLTAGASVKDRRYITALVTRQSWYRNLFLAFKLYNWTLTSPSYPIIIIHSSVHVPLLCSYAKNFLSKRQLVSSLYLLSVKKRLVPTQYVCCLLTVISYSIYTSTRQYFPTYTHIMSACMSLFSSYVLCGINISSLESK